jgi:hypothetical protein
MLHFSWQVLTVLSLTILTRAVRKEALSKPRNENFKEAKYNLKTDLKEGGKL